MRRGDALERAIDQIVETPQGGIVTAHAASCPVRFEACGSGHIHAIGCYCEPRTVVVPPADPAKAIRALEAWRP